MLMLLLLVAGGLSYGKLGLDYFPDVDIPVVVVTTTLPGSAAEEMEGDVSDKIEGAIETSAVSTRARSTRQASRSSLRCSTSKPIDVATRSARQGRWSLPKLPKGIDAPV